MKVDVLGRSYMSIRRLLLLDFGYVHVDVCIHRCSFHFVCVGAVVRIGDSTGYSKVVPVYSGRNCYLNYCSVLAEVSSGPEARADIAGGGQGVGVGVGAPG